MCMGTIETLPPNVLKCNNCIITHTRLGRMAGVSWPLVSNWILTSVSRTRSLWMKFSRGKNSILGSTIQKL